MTRYPTPWHNRLAERFEIDLDGQIATANYRREDDGTLVFHHTFVPEPLRGRGLAGAVVKAGLEYARENWLAVVPQCPYVARYIQRHRQYQSLLAKPAR